MKPDSLNSYLVDRVEEVAGLDFFHLLEDGQEERLEAVTNIGEWWN